MISTIDPSDSSAKSISRTGRPSLSWPISWWFARSGRFLVEDDGDALFLFTCLAEARLTLDFGEDMEHRSGSVVIGRRLESER